MAECLRWWTQGSKTSLICLLLAVCLWTSFSTFVIVPVRISAGNRNPSGSFNEASLMKGLFNTSREEEASGGNSVGTVELRKKGLPA